ncbi:unnamed protein product [Amoebophrya sp. A25]|nr:unnamed protein product [Amoebophrya sp. A25]|eukprot:GSA25T00002315001.1
MDLDGKFLVLKISEDLRIGIPAASARRPRILCEERTLEENDSIFRRMELRAPVSSLNSQSRDMRIRSRGGSQYQERPCATLLVVEMKVTDERKRGRKNGIGIRRSFYF